MKAMIFAAGLGTRLRPFTIEHPKALVPVGGRPILGRVIDRLVDAGIRDIVINVHHFAEQIVDFIDRYDTAAQIHVSDESDLLLDTGGGILRARQWLGDDTFVVHNADILTDLPLEAMARRHAATGADATLLTRNRPSTRHLYFARANDRLKGWSDDTAGRTRPEGFVAGVDMYAQSFGGIHIMSPSVFEVLERYAAQHGPVFPIIPFYVDNARDTDIRAYDAGTGYRWADIGTYAKLADAERMFGLDAKDNPLE